MAQVIGNLRPDATHGERETLRFLKQNLPKEYIVYVEPPLRAHRQLRYPDFVVLTNYGYIVLEVKDWVHIVKATPHQAVVAAHGKERPEPNPVTQCREYALLLHQKIEEQTKNGEQPIPYSFSVILIHQPPAVISQLRQVWGEEFVLGRDDLINPNVLLNRMRLLFPAERMRPLTRPELDRVRAVINPVVVFEAPDRGTIILDEQQERLVTEPPRESPTEQEAEHTPEARQESLFAEATPLPTTPEALPAEGQTLSQNIAIRLVRGYSGSGKTLVLMQRARYLRAIHPDWHIVVLTYNKPLQEQLSAALQSDGIKVHTFDSLCLYLLKHSETPRSDLLNEWLEQQNLPPKVFRTRAQWANEINWLRDMGITRLEDYLETERHGLDGHGLPREARTQVFAVYQAYRDYLHQNELLDFEEAHLVLLERLQSGEIRAGVHFTPYHAILVDEAQDWAPAWVRVLNYLIHPEEGVLFLTDDPSQSIYRHFSWKEKGIHVVGRTRWLRVPYRNTYEIYRAAYSLIADSPEIQASLSEAGEQVLPDINPEHMRHGPKPMLRRCKNQQEERQSLRQQLEILRHAGLRDEQMAVLLYRRRDVTPMQEFLRSCGFGGVIVDTLHRLKGLEMEAIFIPGLEHTFANPRAELDDRRLLYMGMTRARNHLFLSYIGSLPRPFEALRRDNLADFL